LGTSGLVNLDLPDTVTEVVLLAENDGGPSERALNEVLPVLIARGIEAHVARPPLGIKDFNDFVNGKSGHLQEAGRALVKEAIEAARKSEAEIEREDEAENDPEDDEGRFSLTETGLWWRNSRARTPSGSGSPSPSRLLVGPAMRPTRKDKPGIGASLFASKTRTASKSSVSSR
jgi:hypothetical protein